jgi:signal transduction histidine kinase
MNDLASGDVDKRVTSTLEELKRHYDLAGDIMAFDANGRLLASSHRQPTSLGKTVIPAEWQRHEKGLVLVDKERDPMTTREIVALDIPVFARFDPKYRIGTLVMTYPWTAVEKQLFGLDDGTVLLERNGRGRILASNPADIVARVGAARIWARDVGARNGFVFGRSVAQNGLIGNWEVVTVQDSDSATRALRWVALQLILLGAFLSIPIVMLSRWLSQKLTAPIADLTRVASEIADTDRLDARAPIPSTEELGSLARSFNRMTDNLERTTREREKFLADLSALNQTLEAKIAARTEELRNAIKAQRRLIGDISHEIKSPLARLSMALGLARRSSETDRPRQFDRIEKEIESISVLASELLTLAKLDGATSPPEFAAVNLAALIDQIVSDAVFETPSRRDDVILHMGNRSISVIGNADLLRRAIENIVRNALFYTSARTQVEITLDRVGDSGARVTVADHGPGVPAGALPHLFEPFYRVDEARARETGGSGVGLALCHRIVQLHGGRLQARNNAPHGLIVEIELPDAPPPS